MHFASVQVASWRVKLYALRKRHFGLQQQEISAPPEKSKWGKSGVCGTQA